MEIPNSSGIYLINVGKVNTLKESFIFDREYDDDCYVYKFGLSKNINERFKTHKRNFAKLNCNIKFEYCIEINHKNLEFYENKVKDMLKKDSICKEFVKKDCNNIGYEEIFILDINDVITIKNFYDKLNDFNAPEKTTFENNSNVVEKIYKCKYCEEDNPDNFYKDRYSTCKKCRNKMNNGNFDKKIKEEVFSKITLNEDSKILIEKFLSEPQKMFDCKSLKDIICSNNNNITTTKLNLDINNKKVENLMYNHTELIIVFNNLLEKFSKLESENKLMKERIERIEMELMKK